MSDCPDTPTLTLRPNQLIAASTNKTLRRQERPEWQNSWNESDLTGAHVCWCTQHVSATNSFVGEGGGAFENGMSIYYCCQSSRFTEMTWTWAKHWNPALVFMHMRWWSFRNVWATFTLTRPCMNEICEAKATSSLQNRKPDSYHRAVALRSCRHGVIEGFQVPGRITGFEMIGRFNRALKQKAIHPLGERKPFAPPIYMLLTFKPPSWIGHVYVCLSKSPPTHEPNLFTLYLNPQILSI